MAIPKQLAFGRTGWHGDQSVSLRSSLGAMLTLVNGIRTQHNALCDKLDADATVPGSYAGFKTALAAATSSLSSDQLAHVAQGGSYSHGDDAVKIKLHLDAVTVLAEDLKTKHNLLVAELDTAALSLNNYAADCVVDGIVSSSAIEHFAQGGSSAHGDAGVQIRRVLEGFNELKAQHNATRVKLDADTVPTDEDYADGVVTAPSL